MIVVAVAVPNCALVSWINCPCCVHSVWRLDIGNCFCILFWSTSGITVTKCSVLLTLTYGVHLSVFMVWSRKLMCVHCCWWQGWLDRRTGHAWLSKNRGGCHSFRSSLSATSLPQSWGHSASKSAAQEESLMAIIYAVAFIHCFWLIWKITRVDVKMNAHWTIQPYGCPWQ